MGAGIDDSQKSKKSDATVASSSDGKKVASVSDLLSLSTSKPRTRPFLIVGLVGAFVSGLVYPAMAFFFAQVFEKFTVSADADSFMDGIRMMAYTFMGLGVIIFISMSVQNTLLDVAAADMAYTFQRNYLSLLLQQDTTYFDLTDVAGIASMIEGEGNKIKKGLGRKLGEGFQFFITMVGGFVYGFYSSWKVSLVILTTVPFLSVSALFLMKMIASQNSAAKQGYQRAGEIAYAAVSGIRTILSLNAVDVTIDKYKGATKEACDTATKREWALGFANGAVMGSMLLGYIAITLFGMWILYDAVMKSGCDPSNAVPYNEPCPTTGMDVFGALMGISFAAMGIPQISGAMEIFTAAREAAYPAFVLKRRVERFYNDDYDVNMLLDANMVGDTTKKALSEKDRLSTNEGSEAPLMDSAEKHWDLKTVGKNTTASADDEPLQSMETTHHKKRIPASKMPPYHIDSSSDAGLKPASCNGTIDFSNVSFSYPSRPQVKVLDGFSLHAESGKTVALVGKSGCGKSSVMSLIERFYDVDNDFAISGDVEQALYMSGIKLDGVDLRNLNLKWLRSQIGLVSQEPKLFARSIRDNIAFGVASSLKEPSQEDIEEAAKLANAHDFITQFPDGYDTKVGDLGSKLSGGQKQRIAIARVLLRRPKILLLDEATSALDSESEVTVQRALDNLLSKDSSMGGESQMTVIVVAHRLSTIKNADMIAVVDKGKIVETGTNRKLMTIEGGGYQALVLAQQSTNENHGSSSHDGSKNHYDANDVDDAAKSSEQRMSVFVPKEEIGLADVGNEIVLKDVHFRYPTRPETDIFRGLNLAVKRGETLALVGPSGQGKSTVMQLIERYYDPTEGTIEFEGRNVKELNIQYYRDQISLVSQEPTLFNYSIMANIKYGKPEATDEEVYEAAKKANAHNFISSFPEGYNTQLGETSLAVSGGQKQRIAIARAIIKQPRVLLLDEATSALDTASERVVQEALDALMQDHNCTTIVIAHRLSTIVNADRIAYISDGKVREIGTHDELMAKPESKYKRLQELQCMGTARRDVHVGIHVGAASEKTSLKNSKSVSVPSKLDEDEEGGKETEKKVAAKARLLAKDDYGYFAIGSAGAVCAGLMFPGWGIIFAYMIEYLYYPVLPCDKAAGIDPIEPYQSCDEYIADVTDTMRNISYKLTYGWLGIIAAVMIGDILVYYGFGTASERMNKRVRDSAFTSLMRQECSFFDFHTVGSLTSQLSDDAAMIHSFSGQPLRQMVMSVSSVLVGVVVSFVYMWPFALVSLATLPFMGFGAEMEMKMYLGDITDGDQKEEEGGPGAIAIESLLNIRTVASLSLEETRLNDYTEALIKKNPESLSTTFKKCSLVASGQFIQMWGTALMFWWGGYVLWKWPDKFTYNGFLISMFSLLFSLSGLGMAAAGATDKDKAKAAGERIFELVERESSIDPLSKEGYRPGKKEE